MASAIDTARAGIEGRLQANWTRTRIAWPGHEFDAGDQDWLRLTLRFGAGEMQTMTSGGWNTVEGLALIDVFTLGRQGLGVLYDYVDTLRDLFDRVTVGAVEFYAASGPRQLSDPHWQGLQIEVPFIIEETS